MPENGPDESAGRLEVLRSVFPSLAPEAVSELCEICLETPYDEGELVAQEGSYAAGLQIVKSGLVKVGKHGDQGAAKRVLRFLGVGELFGLECVCLRHEVNVQYAKAIMPSELLFIECRNMQAFKRQHPEICSDLCRWLAREVVMLEFKLTRDAVESLDRNLALLLIALVHKYGEATEEGVIVNLPVSRQIIADMLGVSVESLTRSLKRFRDRKLLLASGRRLTITDSEGLKSRARITDFYLSIIEQTL
jgi:CRP-like cAMP-binding protein